MQTNTTPQPAKRAAYLRNVPRNVWVMTLTSFLTDISTEMVFNLVPLFLANVLGVRTGVIGLIEGIAETTASLLKIYSGWLSDRLGQRKWLAVTGYGLSAAAKPLLYFATTWGWVLGVRFADRVRLGPEGYPYYTVAAIEPKKYLLLSAGDPKEEAPSVRDFWLFYLDEIAPSTTRLIARNHRDYEPSVANFITWQVVTEPLHFLMEQKMLRSIKSRAEAAAN